VRRGILVADRAVGCDGNDIAIADNDRTNRDVAVLRGVTRGGQGLSDVPFVLGVGPGSTRCRGIQGRGIEGRC
jgi:hypothetical protein